MERIKPSLQLKDDIDLHISGWIVQRIGWVLLLLLLIAASLGVFGTGWLSAGHVAGKNGTVSFERIARFETPMKLVVQIEKADGDIEIRIPRSYLDCMEIDKIVPEPATQKAAGGSAIYTFDAEAESTITFYLMPESTGSIHTELTIDNTNFPIAHFIFP
ncbi:hypothetical protein KK083_28920 [Fulvivirgaceae bacterium PWU4]|uniref:Uncharacterized protein n=1 Tax=Chryseosolibacter histidini TaxID=2782349 RepID=A0AAP2DR03_9BACT|nr:hypothetical protein [Chryseosolibacter histidini]MBT1700950.1 hypothetical protein [Chryseosolibacter histidini]